MISSISNSLSVSQPELPAKPAATQATPTHAAVPTDTVTLSSSAQKSAASGGDVDHDGDSH